MTPPTAPPVAGVGSPMPTGFEPPCNPTSHPGKPPIYQGVPNHPHTAQPPPQVEDLGQDWEHESNYSRPLQQSDVNEVKGGSTSALQSPQIKFDAEGRELAECGCLKRTPPPPPPSQPPFPLTPQNISKIEKWILETYAESAFNVCTHQPLPKMS